MVHFAYGLWARPSLLAEAWTNLLHVLHTIAEKHYGSFHPLLRTYYFACMPIAWLHCALLAFLTSLHTGQSTIATVHALFTNAYSLRTSFPFTRLDL